MTALHPKDVAGMIRANARETERALVRGAQQAALLGEAIVVQATPANSGEARRGWRVRLTHDGAELVNDAPHALILEFGSAPHRPPLEPILRWVMQVAFDGQSLDRIEDAPPEALAFARAVVEKIAKEGTEPHYMVKSNLGKLQAIHIRASQSQVDRVAP